MGRKAGSGRKFEHNGRALSAKEWADETGVPLGTLYSRLQLVADGAWTMAEALETPIGAHSTRGGPRDRSTSPRPPRVIARRSKDDGQLEDRGSLPRLAEADARIEAEIRKLRALVLVAPRRHVDCDCPECLPWTY